MDEKIDVFGVGNAMVDILAMVDDDFVREHALSKGSMTLVDAEKQGALLQDLEHRSLEMQSGGSAANTIIGVAQVAAAGFIRARWREIPTESFTGRTYWRPACILTSILRRKPDHPPVLAWFSPRRMQSVQCARTWASQPNSRRTTSTSTG